MNNFRFIRLAGFGIVACIMTAVPISAKIYSDYTEENGKLKKVWKVICTDRVQVDIPKLDTIDEAVAWGEKNCKKGNYDAPPRAGDIPVDKGSASVDRRAVVGNNRSVEKRRGRPDRQTSSQSAASKNIASAEPIRRSTDWDKVSIVYGEGDYALTKVGKHTLYRIKCLNVDLDFFMDGDSSISAIQGEIERSCVKPE